MSQIKVQWQPSGLVELETRSGVSRAELCCIRLYKIRLAPLTVSAVTSIRIHKGFTPGEFYIHDVLEREGHGKTPHGLRKPVFSQILSSWVKFLQ